MPEFSFPNGFLWGAATSAHQVEGNNIHNDWWAWEQAGKVKESSGLACDHYRRFAEDFDIAASLAHNAHRFSIEWSRIEPKRGQWDDEALQHYVEVIRALRQRGIEPIVTLHHFTSPQWVRESGGWANSKTVEWFARYTQQVARALGNSVRYWITINEPMVYVKMHYVEGVGPPGPTRNVKTILRVIEHLIRAHGLSYHVIHDAVAPGCPSPQVSIAKNIPIFLPCRRNWPLDIWATAWLERFFNKSFLEAITQGRWFVPGLVSCKIPDARATLDFLGVNFYGRQFIRLRFSLTRLPHEACDLDHHPREVTERSLMGWDIFPPALSEVLVRVSRFGLPIMVTESGVWVDDDSRRWSFIERNVRSLCDAMQKGANIIGYLYWSLLDNFEWAHGFAPRFGLVEVDYATQKRRVRESALRYAEICRTNRLLQWPSGQVTQ